MVVPPGLAGLAGPGPLTVASGLPAVLPLIVACGRPPVKASTSVAAIANMAAVSITRISTPARAGG